MKIPLHLLLAAACLTASCRRGEAPAGKADAAPAKAPLRAGAVSADPDAPGSLLKTENIHIFAMGKAVQFSADKPGRAEAALADLARLPASAVKDRATVVVISTVAQTDPALARELLKRWPDGRAEAWVEAARKVAQALAKTTPEAVPDFIANEVPPGLQIDVWAAYLLELPPAAQAPLLENLPEGEERLGMAAVTVAAWLAEDPAAAARWVDEFAAGLDAREIESLGRPWFMTGKPLEAKDWLAAFHMAETPAAQRFFAESAMKYASEEQRQQWKVDLAEAVPGLNDGSPHKEWYSDPAAWVAARTPEQIAALPAEETRELIRHWGDKNPRKALDWALGQGRPEAAHALDLLYYQDAKEAVALAAGVPAGKERDEAITSLCDTAAHFGDEASARQLLPLITDPQQQERARRQVEERLSYRKAKR